MSQELDTCSRSFAELEAQRTETLAELVDWSPQRVSFRPAPGSWSAIEVLDHVVKTETGTIADLRTGLRNAHLLGTEDRPGVAALDRALRSEQFFQVPPGAEDIYPDKQTTLPQVAIRWERTRVELGRMVQELAPEDVRCGLFCHPFAGWMTFAEVLDHFSAHLCHHRFQLARLRVSSARLNSVP
jgi:DinB superfamily